MKHYDDEGARGTEICERCGRKFQDRLEHDAIFHPVYREDSKPEQKTTLTILAKKALSPEQKGLEQYPDTGESGAAYDGERP